MRLSRYGYRPIEAISAFTACALMSGLLSPAGAEDEAVLNRYLDRLKLTELRITSAETAAKKQPSSAADAAAEKKRLGDLYMRWMGEAGDSEKTFARAKVKASEFFDKNPSLRTPELELVLVESDFGRLVNLFTESIDRPTTGQADREKAHQAFVKIGDSLAERVTKFDKEIEAELSKEPTETTSGLPFAGSKFGAKKDAPAPVDNVAAKDLLRARCKYFAAWAYYYAGVSATDSGVRAKLLGESRKLFCDILGFDHEQETLKIEPEYLNLDNIWRARTLQGFAMCAVAMSRRDEEARAAMSALEGATTAPGVRDFMASIRLQAYWNAGRDKEAEEIVDSTLARVPKSPVPGTVSMCNILVRRGQAEPTPGELSRWTKLGLAGFLRTNAMGDAKAAIAKYGIDLTSAEDFQLLRLFGKQAFVDAEKSKDPAKYRSAKTALEKALGKPEAASDADGTADLRFTLAWAEYRLGNTADAQRLFQQAWRTFRRSNDPRAEEAGWMAFACAIKQAESKDPGAIEEARRIGLDFKTDFPKSERAKQIDYLLSQLGKAAGNAPNVDDLKKIQPGSPGYLDARYDLIVALATKSREAKGEEKELLKTEIRQVAEDYLTKAAHSQAERRVRAGLFVVETFADKTSSPEFAEALKRIEPDLKKLDASSSAVVEWQYRQLQRAQAAGDAARVLELAGEIAKSGQGTNFEMPALLVLAKQADREVAEAAESSKHAKKVAAVDIYRRLVKYLGDDDAALKAKKNAVAALSKLAQYEFELEMWAQAGPHFQLLLTVAPNDAPVLRMAAICLVKAHEYAKALPLAKRLTNAYPQGSPEWVEAKYYQLLCLKNTDLAEAKGTYKQFKLLYPEVKDPAWKLKFDELDRELAAP